MRILVTRPRGDAQETAASLVARGHEAIIAPLLEIRTIAGPGISLDNVQAVLATSANGVRALAARTLRRDILLLTVGAKSAQVGKDLGFKNVKHADGDAKALADFTIAELSASHGSLLHAAGSETRGDLAARLATAGFTVERKVLYEAVAADVLPAIAQHSLSQNRVEAVLFFSPRTAAIFARLVDQAMLTSSCAYLRALCISSSTAKALSGLPFRSVDIALKPNEDALLALLD